MADLILSEADWKLIDESRKRRSFRYLLFPNTKTALFGSLIAGILVAIPVVFTGISHFHFWIIGGMLAGPSLGAWLGSFVISRDVLNVVDKLIDADPDLLREKLNRSAND